MWLLSLLGLTSLAVGGAKTVKAISTNFKAHKLNEEAIAIFNQAKNELEITKNKTSTALAALGELKLQVMSTSLKQFVTTIEKVRWSYSLKRYLKNSCRKEGMITKGSGYELDFLNPNYQLDRLKSMALKANEIIAGGVASLGIGSLLAIASYNGAALLGFASTGTAICTLSGIAAKNATLAWLGGGALAAGGSGIAGGITVLGGIVLSPILAIGGILLSEKANANLEVAKENFNKAELAVREMGMAVKKLTALGSLSTQYYNRILALNKIWADHLSSFESLIQKQITNAQNRPKTLLDNLREIIFGPKVLIKSSYLTEYDKQQILYTLQLGVAVNSLIETSLIDKDGNLTKASAKNLQFAQSILNKVSIENQSSNSGSTYLLSN